MYECIIVIAESAVSKAIGAGAGQAYLDEVQALANGELIIQFISNYSHGAREKLKIIKYCCT